MIRKLFFIAVLVLGVLCMLQPAFSAGSQRFLVLCYHDIPKELDDDEYGVDRQSFVATVEYLAHHGYVFIGIDDIVAAREGKKPLPEKSVLLTFDDAYKSFYEFVFPLLKRYKYPCVLSVVSQWIDAKPATLDKYDLMTWEQLKEIAGSDTVEIASHSNDLHKGVLYNPQGNEAAAAVSRIYDAKNEIYETDDSYRTRIRADLLQARATLHKKLGVEPRVFCWPYGRYNQLTVEEAQKADFPFTLALTDHIASIADLEAVDRVVITKNPSILEFIAALKEDFNPPRQLRAVQIDLDLVYDEDPDVTEENLGKLLDRLVDIKAGTVFLQAFADPEGTGNIKSVYFPNRVLPVRMDLFNRVVHQLKTRAEVEVYAWMPTLSFVLPNGDNTHLRVWEYGGSQAVPSSAWYERLSPFHPEVREKAMMLYEDLALNSNIDGVIFQDDLYLNDNEDFNPQAMSYYKEILGKSFFVPGELSGEEKFKWTTFKTKTLMKYAQDLMDVVLYYRPRARFVRTLYAPVIMNPESEEWFAQNYDRSLEQFDYVAIMAYPRLEEIRRPAKWLRTMVDTAATHPLGIEKTIFKVQTYDWNKKEWIKGATVQKWLRQLVAQGARHIAYYPDDYTANQPQSDVVQTIISVEDFPFTRR